MPKPRLPAVRVVPFGEKTSRGAMVSASFISDIYLSAPSLFTQMFSISRIEQLQMSRDRFYVIENLAGEVVGATMVSPRKPHEWFIGETLILPKFRGNKYAAASKVALEKIAKTEGVKTLTVKISSTNSSSIRAARKARFRKTREKQVSPTPLASSRLLTYRKRIA